MKYEVDAMGKQCPIPVVMTKEAVDKAAAGDEIHVFVDNETAVNNLSRLAGVKGCTFVSEKLEEKKYHVRMVSGGNKAENLADAEEECADGAVFAQEEALASTGILKDCVAVIASDKMGEGDDTLGKILIKGYLYALSQLEKLPETILFYNGGAKLTSEGSESLEDLMHMEEEGVEILTCGTCLKFYELSEKLKVGKVTDMYTIAEKMAGATKIIRP